MAAQTFSAVAVARLASKVAGRTVTDKQVRGAARATMARFDKDAHPEYQAHAYSARERDALVALFAERKASRSGRTSAKTATVTRKRARTAKVAAQTPPAPETPTDA